MTSTNRSLWALDPVVNELQLCPAVSAQEFAELMIPGRVSFLGSNDGTVAINSDNANGASKVTNPMAPTLHDTDARRLHPRSLRKILEKHQSWIDEAQFYPPLFLPLLGDLDRERTARALVEHLDNHYYAAYATTLTFQAPLINQCLKQFVGANETSSTLSRPPTNTTSIMHCGALLPLEASALTSSSTIHLITGVRVYIVYPPTPHNLETVQKYLLELTNNLTPNCASVCSELEGGISFVQRAGQTVTIPSFHPTMVLATKTSAGIMIRSRCQDDLSLRLRYLDLMIAQITAVQHVYQQTADDSLEYHTIQLYKDLSTVIRASDSGTLSRNLTYALGTAWRENGSCFRSLLEKHVSQIPKEQIRKSIPKLWNLAVYNQSLKQCPVCNENIRDLSTPFVAHFQKEHWDRIEDVHTGKEELGLSNALG